MNSRAISLALLLFLIVPPSALLAQQIQLSGNTAVVVQRFQGFDGAACLYENSAGGVGQFGILKASGAGQYFIPRSLQQLKKRARDLKRKLQSANQKSHILAKVRLNKARIRHCKQGCSVSGTPTPSRTIQVLATATAVATASATETIQPSATQTIVSTVQSTRTPTASRSPSATAVFTATRTAMASATRTLTPSASASATPTRTATPTATKSATPTATRTFTSTPSPSPTSTVQAGPGAPIAVSANYSQITVPNISPQMFGLNAYALGIPRPNEDLGGYLTYTQLAANTGVSSLHVPGSAYQSKYNWLTGSMVDNGNSKQGWNISDWKKFSDDTGVGIVGVISPWLYYSGAGGGGQDPGAVVQWAKDNNWAPDKWEYWVIGEESYGSWDGDYVSDANTYAAMVKQIAPRMKAVAPNIKIGIVCEVIWQPSWCGAALSQAGSYIDFVDFHWYPHDGWSDPYGTMQHYPWLANVLMPKFNALFNQYNGGRKLDVFIGEYDFWRMDYYGSPEMRRNTTLATALAWSDFLGTAIRSGIKMASGYDFASGSSYGQLLLWNEQSFRSIKYRPTAYVLELWSKYFGQAMVSSNVQGSQQYILPNDGRADWANVTSGGYSAIPVDYVTAYAGIDYQNNKATLVLINKHNDNSFNLNITLNGASINASQDTNIYTLSTSNVQGLMASNRHYDPTPPEVPAPSVRAEKLGNTFNRSIGPHSMMLFQFPLQ